MLAWRAEAMGWLRPGEAVERERLESFLGSVWVGVVSINTAMSGDFLILQFFLTATHYLASPSFS